MKMADDVTIKIGNISFVRKGECSRCGACEKPDCPHLWWEQDGRATCLTHGEGDYLEWNCDKFPDNPFCEVVREGICGYTFEPVTEEDAKRYKEKLAEIKQRLARRAQK